MYSYKILNHIFYKLPLIKQVTTRVIDIGAGKDIASKGFLSACKELMPAAACFGIDKDMAYRIKHENSSPSNKSLS